jgi:hypothetical protein
MTPKVTISNFTVFTSNYEENVDFRPQYLLYSGPGNTTLKDINVTRVFNYDSNEITNGLILVVPH